MNVRQRIRPFTTNDKAGVGQGEIGVPTLDHDVVAASSVNQVRAPTAGQRVVAPAAGERVVAVAADERHTRAADAARVEPVARAARRHRNGNGVKAASVVGRVNSDRVGAGGGVLENDLGDGAEGGVGDIAAVHIHRAVAVRVINNNGARRVAGVGNGQHTVGIECRDCRSIAVLQQLHVQRGENSLAWLARPVSCGAARAVCLLRHCDLPNRRRGVGANLSSVGARNPLGQLISPRPPAPCNLNLRVQATPLN